MSKKNKILRLISASLVVLIIVMMNFIIIDNQERSFSSALSTGLVVVVELFLFVGGGITIILLFPPFLHINNKYRKYSIYRWVYGGFWFFTDNQWVHHSEFDPRKFGPIQKTEINGSIFHSEEEMSDRIRRKRDNLINKIIR